MNRLFYTYIHTFIFTYFKDIPNKSANHEQSQYTWYLQNNIKQTQ